MNWYTRSIKKTCRNSNYVGLLLISASTVPDCVSISPFASLVRIYIDITSSAATINTCIITAGNQKV